VCFYMYAPACVCYAGHQAAWNRDEATVDLGACLDALEKQYKTSKGAAPVTVAVEANRPLVMAFKVKASFGGWELFVREKMKLARKKKGRSCSREYFRSFFLSFELVSGLISTFSPFWAH